MTRKMTGVITPILTPFNDDLTLAAELYVEHAKWLIAQGIHYISPFGTTGEALSMTVGERMQAVDVLIAGGIDPAVLMPGAGLCNFPDTLSLCQHAVERGCAAAMTLPPFFYKNASDDGLFAYFDQLINTIDNPGLKICLYHIPPMAGMGFSPNLAGRLATAFPDTVIAYKDSSSDFPNTQNVMAAAPQLAMFPGSEKFLRAGMEHGAMGCISASCNINPSGIRQVYDVISGNVQADLDQVEAQMLEIRKIVELYQPIPGMKGLLAQITGDNRWRNVRTPLLPVSEQAAAEFARQLNMVAQGEFRITL